ncbi:hypothetical protein GWK08_00270 [Leptobacterium flavescens]|uniref:Calcineurin-like phosphoesterase domain-containing protein n=1 Tax=Leptobacterium flavescens TaxID=472055 RepID=A0A6P0ULD0_9FLAO|nr:metallophosphoesterase [Leptobacterium flavescens]NER11863.1 hypothetical protein [Leptobacterium flavescens]
MIRRKFLKKLTFAGTAVTVGALLNPIPLFGSSRTKKLRIAHITDTHVYNARNCPGKMDQFIEKLLEINPQPDLIFHTGDVIMEALAGSKATIKGQWDLWNRKWEAVPIETKYAIGNHDIHGNASGDRSSPSFGKQWMIDELQMPGRYYDFQRDGWHFIVLDSTQNINGQKYDARIDLEQEHWLIDKLSGISQNTPVMIVSHIPILSSSVSSWAPTAKVRQFPTPYYFHQDSDRIQEIFKTWGAGKVRLCISGHIHMTDKLTSFGVDYLGGGAVCGRWWGSSVFRKTHCGFSMIDLFSDGSYKRTYYIYEWK